MPHELGGSQMRDRVGSLPCGVVGDMGSCWGYEGLLGTAGGWYWVGTGCGDGRFRHRSLWSQVEYRQAWYRVGLLVWWGCWRP